MREKAVRNSQRTSELSLSLSQAWLWAKESIRLDSLSCKKAQLMSGF